MIVSTVAAQRRALVVFALTVALMGTRFVTETWAAGAVAMGKCGGRELNYVSDVDVVFVCEPAGTGGTAGTAEVETAMRAGSVLAARMMEICRVVAWPVDGSGDLTDRRHWHTGCWKARDRRSPDVERSRNAPRYG